MMDSPPTKEHKSPQRESPLPSVSERLAYLRPSRELLDFYRQKVAQFDGEHDDLLQMLEKYRSTAEEQHKLQWEVRQREEEIAELQNALSDMQVYLFQEREQALRLYAENDRLKIRELEDRKKIQHLLALVGPDPGEITYFHREPPHKVTIPQKKVQLRSHEESKVVKPRPVSAKGSKKSSKDGEDATSSEQYKRDNQTLLLQPPPACADALFIMQPKHESSQTHREETRALQEELKQAHKLADMYREQCVNLETDLSQIREEGDVGREIFKERSDKMAKRLQLMTQRYEALEKRRAMEVEGFKTDIKHLRQKVKDVEKYLFKLTLNVGPDQDLAILHEVRQTNSRTVKVQSELKNLRAKIYKLENDLRFC
ncbi:coiled-coil domain-containing protein 77-like [Sinocyclocheilus rhinocerous]|uniref:coiled-coil domain-containing protein 77-like n=1 Tax=Sinocyclocheilus rhinocerous TaxID=307959 RepID=UPI0007B84C4D|nr:PREDICTED: coiled-coil domain-containing protein 77-like [Sinocyclocheilus rhinocerous]